MLLNEYEQEEERDTADYDYERWEFRLPSAAMDAYDSLLPPRCDYCGHTASAHTLTGCGAMYHDPVQRCFCTGYETTGGEEETKATH